MAAAVLAISFTPTKYIPPHLRNRSSSKPLPVQLFNLVTCKYESHKRSMASFLQEVNEGLNNIAPEPVEEGVNGTYFVKNKDGQTIAIFKPNDEEGDSEHNPKNVKGNTKSGQPSPTFGSIGKGIKPGEAAHREMAAYLLDTEGFHSIPMTTLVTIEHPSFLNPTDPSTKCKFGSLQKFIPNNGAAWDVAPKVFPVNEVHKIGILDVMILNSDRHGGNILFNRTKETGYSLVPIDHSYSLPHSLEHAWFDWFYWPQAKQPFDADTLAYIDAIDVEAKARLLAEIGIAPDCIQVFKICTHLLKVLAARNFSLFEIASVVCRKDLSKPSLLEMFCKQVDQELEVIKMNTESSTHEKYALQLNCLLARFESLDPAELPTSPSTDAVHRR
jgi:hypothetical protein